MLIRLPSRLQRLHSDPVSLLASPMQASSTVYIIREEDVHLHFLIAMKAHWLSVVHGVGDCALNKQPLQALDRSL